MTRTYDPFLPLLCYFFLYRLSYFNLSCKPWFVSLLFHFILGFGLFLSLYKFINSHNILLSAGQCVFYSFTQSLCNLFMAWSPIVWRVFYPEGTVTACSCHSDKHSLFLIYVIKPKIVVDFVPLRLQWPYVRKKRILNWAMFRIAITKFGN